MSGSEWTTATPHRDWVEVITHKHDEARSRLINMRHVIEVDKRDRKGPGATTTVTINLAAGMAEGSDTCITIQGRAAIEFYDIWAKRRRILSVSDRGFKG